MPSKIIFSAAVSAIITNFIAFILVSHIKNNYIYYLLIVVLYSLFFYFFNKNCNVLSIKFKLKKNNINYCICLIIILLCVVFYITDYFPINYWANKPISTIGWHNNKILNIFIFFIGLLVGNYLIINDKDKKFKNHDIKYFLFVLFVSFIMFILNFQPYTSNGYSFYHRHAYIYEIYKSYNFVPYSSSTSGIYGHYGLFYIIPLHLLGGCNISNITLLISILSSMVVFLFAYTVKKLTNKHIFCYLSTLSLLLPYVYFTDCHLYYQSYPHRYFLIVLFIAILINKEKIKHFNTIFWFSAVFAILWSNDIGIVYSLSYLAYNILMIINDSKGFKQSFILAIKALLKLILLYLFAILIINIFNYFTGGNLILLDFFYPYNVDFVNDLQFSFYQPGLANHCLLKIANIIFSNNIPDLINKIIDLANNTGITSIMLMPIFYFYFYVIVFCLTLLIILLNKIFKRKADNYTCLVSVSLIFIFGILMYYFNRPAYGNIMIILPLLFVCLLYVIDKTNNNNVNIFINNLILIMSLAVIISLPEYLKNIDVYEKKQEYDQVQNFMSKILEDDTLIVGTGAFEFYNQESSYLLSCYDDIHFSYYKKTEDALINELSNHKNVAIFLYYDGDKLWGEDLTKFIDNNYHQVYEYNGNNVVCKYYKIDE